MTDQYTAGMRRAAEMFHEEQIRVWGQDIIEGLGFADVLKIESYDDNIAAHEMVEAGLCRIRDAILAAIPPAAPWTPPEDRQKGLYLIFKSGRGFYRPNARGYTMNALDAGRYTLAEAMDHTYPNGPEGPRDGLDYMPAPGAQP